MNREQKPDISFLKKSKKVREQPCAYEVLQKKAIVIVTISLCWYIRSKLSVSSCCMIDRFSGLYFTVRPTEFKTLFEFKSFPTHSLRLGHRSQRKKRLGVQLTAQTSNSVNEKH